MEKIGAKKGRMGRTGVPVNSLSKCKAKLGYPSEAKRLFPLAKVTERIIRGDHDQSQC